MTYRRYYRVLMFLLIMIVSSGCSHQSVVQSSLEKILEENQFTLYTPFRTKDFPATIFVLTANHKGHWTEITLSEFDRTFSVDSSRLFDPKGQPVEFADELSDGFEFDIQLGLELVGLLVHPELGAKYTKKIVIRLGDPKLKHLMSLERLTDVRFDLRDSVSQTLKFIESKEQLENVYIVLETLMVGSLEIELDLKDEFRGKLSLEEIKKIAKLGVSVETNSDGIFTVKSSGPLIIGYKAMQFPDTILRDQVGVGDFEDAKLVEATEFNRIKRK